MELGGVETSLIGLLGALDPARVDIDLFVYSHTGAMMHYIPNYVNLLDEIESYSMFERPMVELLRKGQIKVLLGRIISKIKHRIFLRNNPGLENDASISQFLGDCVTPALPPINRECKYDLCISYMNPHNIGLEKVNAAKRMAWIHTDYSKIDIDIKAELPVWGGFDYITAISPEVKRSFADVFPSLTSKIIEIENVLPVDMIRTRAEESDVTSEFTGEINLLSIGRFCTAKNYDNVPDICRRIRETGLNIKWYIIGFGGQEELIRNKIKDAKMEEFVILLGKKDNPYPYIKACDIYVQPSRYEGKSITVREAQTLGKPVVITAYPTAVSQIRNGIDGVIVPLDNEGCARDLTNFIKNKDLQKTLSTYCSVHDFANRSEVEKLYKLI